MRKSPRRHRVKSHMRKGRWRASFWRGHGLLKTRMKSQKTLPRILGRFGYYTKTKPVDKGGIRHEYLGTFPTSKIEDVIKERPRRIFGNLAEIPRERLSLIKEPKGEDEIRLYAGIKR